MKSIKTLDTLSDKDKTLLAAFPSIEFDMDRYKELGNNITLSDFEKIISEPDKPYLGEGAQLAGILRTPKEIMQEIKDAGLGYLNLKDIEDDNKTGFFALALEDSNNNIGIIFRQTNGKSGWMNNITEYLGNDSDQIKQAKTFFKRNKEKNGNNYLYGHSLGGNLVAHLYLKNYEDISNAFTYNGTPIDPKLLTTKEQINAFNDEKYDPVVIGGDIVAELKDKTPYENNVRYVLNNGIFDVMPVASVFTPHALEAASFDEKGNFIEVSKEQAYENYQSQLTYAHSISDYGENIKNEELENSIKKIPFYKKIFNTIKNIFNNIKKLLSNKTLPSPQEEKILENTDDSRKQFANNMQLENFVTEDKDYVLSKSNNLSEHKANRTIKNEEKDIA